MEIDIKAEYLRLAYIFRAKDTPEKPEYAPLVGVRVEPHKDGAIIVATDGACMFIGIDETGYADQAVNLTDDLDKAITYMDDKRRVLVDANSLRVTLKGTTLITVADPILEDQGYPDWRRVIPTAKPQFPLFPASFAGKYLAAIGRLRSYDPRFDDIIFYGNGSKEPAVLRFTAMPSIMVLLMPCVPKNWSPTAQLDRKWLEQFTLAAPEGGSSDL